MKDNEFGPLPYIILKKKIKVGHRFKCKSLKFVNFQEKTQK